MYKVMLVDDEPLILRGMAVVIEWEEYGFEIVKSAANGLEAYEYLKDNKVDLIIADIKMPEMDGLELVKRIREEGISDAFYVILSGYNDFEYARHAIRYSCMDYLLKPIDNDMLIEILKRAAESLDEVRTETGLPVEEGALVLVKPYIDELVTSIEQNDLSRISSSIDELYSQMEKGDINKEMQSMNINYLRFQLIHLAPLQDETDNPEEILNYINENVFDPDLIKGGRTHLKRTAIAYAGYLAGIRRSASRGVLAEIEKEIRNNYGENLTLRELSRKYYVNPSYLGQMFKKKYDQSFKDYLCYVRIDEAAKQLINTDEKISVIAERVGYRDPDYFLTKFTQVMGVSPAKYRKNGGLIT